MLILVLLISLLGLNSLSIAHNTTWFEESMGLSEYNCDKQWHDEPSWRLYVNGKLYEHDPRYLTCYEALAKTRSTWFNPSKYSWRRDK